MSRTRQNATPSDYLGQDCMTDDQEAPQRKRVLPRVSNAAGGLRAGIDLTKPSTLQEMDDLEYVRGMQSSEFILAGRDCTELTEKSSTASDFP